MPIIFGWRVLPFRPGPTWLRLRPFPFRLAAARKICRGDELLLLERLLRCDLLVFNGLFKGCAKIHVVEQQVDNMDRVRRQFSFESLPDRLPYLLTVRRDVDAFILDRFVFEILRHPRLDQNMKIVRSDRAKQRLHRLGRHLIVKAGPDEDILGLGAKGREFIQYGPLHLDIGMGDEPPRPNQMEPLVDLSDDRTKTINDADRARPHDHKRFGHQQQQEKNAEG